MPTGVMEEGPPESWRHSSWYRYSPEAKREVGRNTLAFLCPQSLPILRCIPLAEPKRNPEAREVVRSNQMSNNLKEKSIGFADRIRRIKESKCQR